MKYKCRACKDTGVQMWLGMQVWTEPICIVCNRNNAVRLLKRAIEEYGDPCGGRAAKLEELIE